ncbi:beta-galactosidase [Halyomorpha halys]|uniref:beta-galactosidase n=1 Tax=Halyomorpha halys TaxID=286706 RepID=UPI0006D5077C|nr:beta-galactosidase-like [Halyomorpha halys]
MASFHFLPVLLLLQLCPFILAHTVVPKNRSFEVDYDNNRFLKDGLPFSYVSGEMHYFRIPKVYWRDRLEKLKAVGCDTVCTYIEWSLHEPSPGNYIFTGEQDISEYLNIAQELGLNVLLRPGPYICAEREFGGFPAWLLTKNPTMKLRTSDPTYTGYVSKWLKVLMEKIQPHLYGNGGNIIMVQVENEYGLYDVHDADYLTWLRDQFKSYIGDAAVLFTTDPDSSSAVSRGRIPGVFSTIDSNPTNDAMDMFRELRKIQPNGPLVNSEFYVGWISYWGKPLSKRDTAPIVNSITSLMQNNISFSMYMLHGGTNFGFTAGSGTDSHYISDLTSYDYDAPISEAGDLTSKYEAIRDTILKNRNLSSPLTIEKVKQKGNYGKLELKPICTLFSCPIGIDYPNSEYPVTFEALGQYNGFVSYSTQLEIQPQNRSLLVANIRDRAIVYLDDIEAGTLQYTYTNEFPLSPSYQKGQYLRLLIENMGRRNFGLLSDCTKGLVDNATVDGNILKNWEIKGYPFNPEDIAALEGLEPTENVSFPAIFRGQFTLQKDEEPLDTFVSMENWGKGIVFINEYNLGRYWQIGPQVTLYVPACYLQKYPAKNTVTVLELHNSNPGVSVTFLDTPIFVDPKKML